MKSDYKKYIGYRFGRWKVLGLGNISNNRHIQLKCQCDCGIIRSIDKSSLIAGLSKSCGCSDKTDITGKTIGTFKVIRFAGVNKKNNNLWEVRCLLCRKISIRTRMNWKDFSVCECISTRQPKEETAIKSLYNGYIRQANERKIHFEIDVDSFKKITKQNCHYCGNQPSNICKRKKSVYIYNGLDRINSEKDYTLDNIVPCCSQCNTMKWDMSYQDFINKIKIISKHLNLKE